MKYAYSSLTLKAVEDGEKRVLRGLATTPTPDRSGDIVEPKGAEFKLPIPFLYQHDSAQPIGHVTKATVTKDGIDVVVELVKVDEPGPLKDRLDTAWQEIKAGLVRGLSIGFRPKEYNLLEDGSYGMRFVKWLWLELSAVTIPANGDCSIVAIKSMDEAQRASRGHSPARLPGASGETGHTATTTRSTKGSTMKTLQQLREERDTKAARLNEIKAKLADTSVDVSDAEEQEFDDLETEIKQLDRDIRVKRADLINATSAKGIDGSSSEGATRSRAARDVPTAKAQQDDDFAGQSFARLAKAKAIAHKQHMPLSAVIASMYGKAGEFLMKTAVPGGGTGSGEWGSELVGIDNRYTGDFVTFLYGMTAFDKLGLREAPRNTSVKGMDGAATGFWVGESKSIPASAPSASATDLVSRKVGGLCILSNELLADSSPGADMLVRDALAEALAKRLDETFFSAAAAVTGVSPAGILNGLTQVNMTAGDAAALRSLINALYAPFIANKNAGGLTLVMSPGTAKAIGMLVNALGQSEFPGLTAMGGTLLGDRVVVGDNIDPSQIILLKPSDIWRIGDTGVDIAISSEAMVEQDTAPTGASDTPVASSATMVSMFSTDSSAIRAIRRVGFAPRRAGVVQYTDTADFGGVAS